MKTGEAAKIMGVDRSTLLDWINIRGLDRFFSTGARGTDGSMHRILNDADLLVLNTIRGCRSQNMDWEEIEAHLETGEREQSFPQNAISVDPRTIPLPQAEASARALATMRERDAALARVDELSGEIEELRSTVERMQQEKEALLQRTQQEKEAAVQKLQSEKDAVRKTLFREMADLYKQIGRLEGELASYRKNGT